MKYYEVLWYTDLEMNSYQTKEFSTRQAALNFYNRHKDDEGKFGWWVTRRNEDGEVIEDIVY